MNQEEEDEIDLLSNKLQNKYMIQKFQNLLKRTQQSITLWEQEIKERKYELTDYEKHLLKILYYNKRNLQIKLNNRMLG